jgi:hypothetical protein
VNKRERKKLEKIIRRSKQKRYRRRGDCNFCGDCCDNEECEYFERVNADLGFCMVYGKPERFRRCLLFPQDPKHPFERCGYYFHDRHDGGKIIKPSGWPGPMNKLEDFE